jgi:hypothetical protein
MNSPRPYSQSARGCRQAQQDERLHAVVSWLTDWAQVPSTTVKRRLIDAHLATFSPKRPYPVEISKRGEFAFNEADARGLKLSIGDQ